MRRTRPVAAIALALSACSSGTSGSAAGVPGSAYNLWLGK